MSWQPVFEKPEEEVIVETPLMRSVASRTMAVHKKGVMVVWSGLPRNGKTLTARWLKDKINEAYKSNPYAFRAVHYEVGQIERWSGNEAKKGLRSLYHATVGPLSEGVFRRQPIEALAKQHVLGLRATNTQMVFIDEAGLLSLDAIRGMVLSLNTAGNMGWPLTLVFIGMDDLPTKMREYPHIRHRIHEWCYFKPYSITETHGLLAALHPHFATLDLSRAADYAQVEFIHEQFQGLPGRITAFLKRLKYRERELGLPIDLAMLRAVHLLTVRDEESAINDANSGFETEEHSSQEILEWGSRAPGDAEEEPEEGTAEGEARDIEAVGDEEDAEDAPGRNTRKRRRDDGEAEEAA